MSVEQIDKIDFISTSPNGSVKLTISDHLIWDEENEHVLLLQDKINSYLNFVDSGQIFEEYPNSKNKNIAIGLIMKFEPNEYALNFLQKCKSIIKELNIEFNWKTLK
ncbi:hypothetical protein KSK37_02995 [Kaistella sp. DKR-2]|uniref:DUF6572 domain-containing protein n=1 Tax=Kaistella soli TaxID=2849654 RepID=UPI001C26DFD6|nr:DUF6572 domain-containing protein [Kaistella soli]MBU8882043.1 hypothetical protein [Kaistella soli]